ncbi:MAG: hypothetical protein APR55_10870 [Methanolinea sp. SDB]|nr:MAG: hypothetical protein APR55_10870 [Methanolinea sp. SDB]
MGILIAILILVLLQGTVSAATDTCVVSGNLAGTISISVSESINLGTLTVGENTNTTGTLAVTSNYADWDVIASDEKASDKGYMTSGSERFTNLFELKEDSGSWVTLDTSRTFFEGTGDDSTGYSVRQVVDAADLAGEYTITVTFTTSVS